MNHSSISEEARITAQIQVEAFAEVFCVRYGIKEEEIPELLGNLRWLGKHKSSIEGLSVKAAMVVIGLVVTGMAVAFWEGIKHLLAK